MLHIFAAALLSGAAAVPAAADANDLPNLFVAACLDGRASLLPGSDPVSFELLPSDLRRRLGEPAAARVWRIGTESDAFLYLLDYSPSGHHDRRICGVASQDIDVHAAADAIELRVTGAVYPNRARSIEWTDPDGNYTALVTKAGKFDVLQVNWLSDEARANFRRIYKPLVP